MIRRSHSIILVFALPFILMFSACTSQENMFEGSFRKAVSFDGLDGENYSQNRHPMSFSDW